MCDRLSELRGAMEYYALDFDPNGCSVSEAEAVLRHATVIKNMANTVAVLAAGRVAESNVWKRAGARSAAHDLAKKTGTGVGTAAGSLDTAKRLRKLPKTAEAARKGELSERQASLIADAADVAPGAEHKLLEKAKSGSLPELRDECAKAKAAANPNLDERRRKIHDQRFLREHTDTDGAWNLRARDNPEVGAAVMAALAPIVDKLFAKARAEGRRERPEAYAMDALAAMAQRASGDGAADPRRSHSDTKVLARIDFDTLLRGYPIDGETCELVGYGPVAVSAIKDMIDSRNPFLVAIATRGIDVVGVAHLGRKFTAAQVSALQWRDPTCAAQGCNASKRLEMDHRHDWADTKVSLYEWADPLCCHDHDKKPASAGRLSGARASEHSCPQTIPATRTPGGRRRAQPTAKTRSPTPPDPQQFRLPAAANSGHDSAVAGTDTDFETGEYDVAAFADELEGERNHEIGTRVLLENERVRVWEIRLEPGDRVPFHWHTTTYLFVCVDGGRLRTRFANGTWFESEMPSGSTVYSALSAEEPEVHDLENTGDTTVRFTTVELLDE